MKIKDPTEQQRLLVLNVSLIGIFAAFVAGGYWYGGVDFAKGTLVGCLIVAINFFVTQRLVGNLLTEGSAKPVLVVAYLGKLALSALILFVAVIKLELNLVGIMLGLSSVVFSAMFSALVKRKPAIEDE